MFKAHSKAFLDSVRLYFYVFVKIREKSPMGKIPDRNSYINSPEGAEVIRDEVPAEGVQGRGKERINSAVVL